MTEAKLQGLAAYLRARLSGASDRDAVRKSKMSLQALDRLAFLAERYYPARARALEFEAELARLRAQPKPEAGAAQARSDADRARALVQKLNAHERFRGQFFQQVKPENRALIDKYEPTFVAIVNEQQVKAAALQAEAVEEARKTFDETVIPRFAAYLSARAAQKSETDALAASRLNEKQVLGLSQLVTEYSRQKMTAQRAAQELPEARRRLEGARAGGRSTSFEERLISHYEGQLAEFEAFKEAFAQRNSQEMQSAIEANFEALLAAYQRHAGQPGNAK